MIKTYFEQGETDQMAVVVIEDEETGDNITLDCWKNERYLSRDEIKQIKEFAEKLKD